ncbi:MAG TPA: response regulator [Caulobacteraceae bacterium]|nr:response regulator [Caulobacteraceae bacterium]
MNQPARVLVVEDEILIQTLIEEALAASGYAVAVADNGGAALTQIEVDPSTLQALVTDVGLGEGPNGWDVARRARELIHDLPVVYITAENGSEWSAQGVPSSTLVVKPFAVDQVVTAVSVLVNEAAAKRAT